MRHTKCGVCRTRVSFHSMPLGNSILIAFTFATLLIASARAAAQPTPLPNAIRTVSDTDSTVYGVLLAFESGSGDYVKEILPSGVTVDIDSVLAFTATYEPDFDTVQVYPSVTISGDTLTVSGSGFSVVIYELSRPLQSSESIIGEIRYSSHTEEIVQVEDIAAFKDSMTASFKRDLNESLLQDMNDLFAQNGPSGFSGVYLNNNESWPQLPVAASGFISGGEHVCDRVGTALESLNGHGHVNADWFDFSSVAAETDVGSAAQLKLFSVFGCDDDDPAEFDIATFTANNVHWDGYQTTLSVSIKGLGMGVFSNYVRMSFVLVENSPGIPVSIVARDVLTEGEPGLIPGGCYYLTGSDTGSLSWELKEGSDYATMVLLEGATKAYGVGFATVDFFSEPDGACWDPEGCEPPDPGLYWDAVDLTFSENPLPELVVHDDDLTVDRSSAKMGDTVQVCIEVHDYGSADSPMAGVAVDFEANDFSIGSCTTAVIERCRSEQCCITWIVNQDGPYLITAEVDPNNAVHEKCEPDQNPNPACRHSASTILKGAPGRASVLLIDQSASMRGGFYGLFSGLYFARRGSHLYVESNYAQSENGPGDAVSIYSFNSQTYRDLALTFADSLIGKPAMRSAIDADHGTGVTKMYDAMWTALDEACELKTIKGLLVISDGNACGTQQHTASDVTSKSIACQTPFLIANPGPFYFNALLENFPWPDTLSSRSILSDLAIQSGGGFYICPPRADTIAVDALVQRMNRSMERAATSGWLVSPIGDGFVKPGGANEAAAGVNLSVLQPGLSIPDTIKLMSPAGVSFASIPSVHATGMNVDLGGIWLGDMNTVLHIPLLPGQMSGYSTGIITIGDGAGIGLSVGEVTGNIDLAVFASGGSFLPDTVTVAQATSDVVVRTITPLAGRDTTAINVTISGVNFGSVNTVSLIDVLDTLNVYGLTAINQLSDSRLQAIVPVGVPSGYYHVSVNNGSKSNKNSQTLYCVLDPVTGIGVESAPLKTYALIGNRPNPFNPITTIYYNVPAGGGTVSLRIYDVTGSLIRTLVDGRQSPGSTSVTWDGTSDRGQTVATGIYFCRMTAPGFTSTRKMVLLR